jgi:hypothetical protein
MRKTMSHDPYAAPKSNVSGPSDCPIRLYSPAQAVCGALLGGPVGLVYFLHANFDALENDRLKKKTLVFGIVFILSLLVILSLLPEGFPSAPFTILYAVAAHYIAKRYQITKQGIIDSPQYDFHSNWRVFGISILCGVGSALLIAGPIFVLLYWL